MNAWFLFFIFWKISVIHTRLGINGLILDLRNAGATCIRMVCFIVCFHVTIILQFFTNLIGNALGKQNSDGNVLECYRDCISFRLWFSILLWLLYQIVIYVLQSVPRYLWSTFRGFLIKVHISVKEVQLKSMKGKISKMSFIDTIS